MLSTQFHNNISSYFANLYHDYILLSNYDMILAPEYNWNLILLGQLWKNDIVYYDTLIVIILTEKSKIIISVKKDQIFFILNLILSG